jgi:acyl-coenzyme A thioesterase PaaI-like protein
MSEAPTESVELVRAWLEHSPFAGHLGIRIESLGKGDAVVSLPYDEKLASRSASSTPRAHPTCVRAPG